MAETWALILKMRLSYTQAQAQAIGNPKLHIYIILMYMYVFVCILGLHVPFAVNLLGPSRQLDVKNAFLFL